MNWKLFQQIKIANLTLKNRVILSAAHLCYATDGKINDRIIEFYRERAKNNLGAIVVGGCYPQARGKVWFGEIGLASDDAIEGFARLAEALHAEGAKLFVQLLHGGSCSHPGISKHETISASHIPSQSKRIIPRAATVEEIHKMVASYGQAAARARQAGVDGVELHGGMGYLINQFLSPLTNVRTDDYGGSPEKRLRFAKEVVEAVKEKAGRDYPVIMKLSGTDLQEGGLELQESLEIARALDEVDAFHISPGWHSSSTPLITKQVPHGAYVFLAKEFKSVVSVPVITSIRINDPRQAESILQTEQADIIAMTRPFLADPEILTKARDGKFGEIRTCLACNQGCFDRMLQMKPVTCVLNPQVGMETERAITPAADKKRVLIIGAGPAGLECARVGAMRGHEIYLYEKKNHIGGQLNLAGKLPCKSEFGRLVDYYRETLNNSAVRLKLCEAVSEETITKINPDIVVVASGAKPRIPEIEGVDSPVVCLAEDVLEERVIPGKRVAIIGGGPLGCDIALYLAQGSTTAPEVTNFLLWHQVQPEIKNHTLHKEREITILEIDDEVGKGIGRSTHWVVMGDLKRWGITIRRKIVPFKITTDTKISGGVYLRDESQQEEFLPADTVIIATGYQPVSPQTPGLEQYNVTVIGDSNQPRNLLDAIHEGFMTGLNL